MGDVRERSAAVLLLLAIGGGTVPLGGCSGSETSMTQEAGVAGRARADMLVASYARHLGAGQRELDPSGDAAFGESGLHYDAARDMLVGRAFVQRVFVEDAPPDELANLRRMVAFLNDPKVGGMYDRGGGLFVLDEPRNAYFLVRDFPVAGTDPAALAAGMDAMVAVAAPWVTTWFFEVAMVMHGKRPPPGQPVAQQAGGPR